MQNKEIDEHKSNNGDRISLIFNKHRSKGISFRGRTLCEAGVFWENLKEVAFNDLDNGSWLGAVDKFTRQWFILKNKHTKLKKGHCHYCCTLGYTKCLYSDVRTAMSDEHQKMCIGLVESYSSYGLTSNRDDYVKSIY
jgi:hypothetical protein